MSRRANGEGSLFRRGDGRWAGFITLPSLTGEQRKKWVTGKTQESVRLKMEQLRELYGKAPKVHEADVPFREYAHSWLAYLRPHVRARTHTTYESELKNHIMPHLGRLKLIDVEPQHVRAMQFAVLEKAGPVAAKGARGRARTILQQAYEDGLIPRNPASVVKPVKTPPRKFDVWGEHEVDTFLQATLGVKLYAMFYLGLTTGLRPGELLALEWQDIGDDEVRVRQTLTTPKGGVVLGPPKSSAGRRAVPLPPDARQLLERNNSSPFVFPSSVGGFMAPRNVYERAWLPALGLAGLPHVRPYVLRHTFASLSVAGGVDAATLAKWMGHTDISFTLRTYSHFFERRVPVRAKTLGELLGRQ